MKDKQIKQVYEIDNLLFKKEDSVIKWNHKDIMNNQLKFIEFLQDLTNIEKLVKQLNENKFLEILKNNSNTVNNFLTRIKKLINEIDVEDYKCWKEYKINKYTQLFVNQIKEEQTFCSKKEVYKFNSRVKRERYKFNFILECLYNINVQYKLIKVINLNNKVSKQEYVDNLNIVLNILLLLDYLFSMYDIFISHTYKFDEKQKLITIIHNQYEYKDMYQAENMYKCLNTLLYSFYQITILEEKDNG